MGGLERSNLWAGRIGPFTSICAWGNCRDKEEDPEGAALFPPRAWGETAPEFDSILFYPFIAGTAMPSPLWYNWGRENIASSYRFPPICPVAPDKVLEWSGAEKPPQPWMSLDNAHFCKGRRTSAKLHILQKEKPYHPLQLNILVPSDRSSSWHWKAALGGFLNPPSMITTFTRPPNCFQGSEDIFHC